MGRKTRTISLCLLGAVAMVGPCACCCGGWWDDMQQGGGHGGHGGGSHFFVSNASHAPSNTSARPGASSTSRGGFGATGSAAHGGGE